MKYLAFEQIYTYIVPSLITEVELFPVTAAVFDNGIKASAVWDTGATRTFLSSRFEKILNIVPFESQGVTTLNGVKNAGIALVAVKLPNNLLIPDKRVFISDFPAAFDILIGMDIIQLGDLRISNANNKTTFSFVIPPLQNTSSLAFEADCLNKAN